METFIRWYDDALPSSLCDNLIDEFEKGWPTRRNKPGKRNQEVCLTDKRLTTELVKIVETFAMKYTKDCNAYALGRYRGHVIENFALKKYEIGDFHDWHTDSTGPYSFRRFLAIQIYLNTVDDGGCTEFQDTDLFIKPRQGRIAFFPTGWTHMHRGASPLSGPKYSANGYFVFPIEWVEGYKEGLDINSSTRRQ